MAEVKTRRSSTFSWDEVDPDLVRKMLIALYNDKGRRDEVGLVKKLSDKSAAYNAAQKFGSPPKPVRFTSGVDVALIRYWLPKARADVVDELTATVRLGLSGAARSEPTGTKAQQVEFLQRRRHTRNFLTNLHKSFVRAHKVTSRVDVTPSGRPGDPDRPHAFLGEGAEPMAWYDFQAEAQKRLHALWGGFERGNCRLVLPTGAGKTATIGGWLLSCMAEDPNLRVLWLVHQQELVDQAVNRIETLARSMPRGFRRIGRSVHTGAGSLSVLADDGLDFAAVTYQSFRSLDAKKKKLLDGYLRRPTIVIVDEAHHAGSPSYDELLDHICGHETVAMVVGLTATPYPSSPAARARFNKRFPKTVHEVPVFDLIRSRVLARPVVTTVDTGIAYELTDREVAAATSGDIPLQVLSKLDQRNRNKLVKETWQNSPGRWGKTLVFATSIAHADELTSMFQDAGANCRSLHSESPDRSGQLAWFRSTNDNPVLVSVGMLTEGVDLPDATTAFIARPTTSPILMRQMVGRVLRGPKAGGAPMAHVVHFRDEWRNLPDVLYPEEVLPYCEVEARQSAAGSWDPGPIIDDDGLALRADVVAQVAHAYEKLAPLFNVEDDDPYNDLPPEPQIRSTRIVGFYDLDEMSIPVFEHQVDGFDRLLDDVLRSKKLQGTPSMSYFEDAPPPYPSQRALKVLVELARETNETPERTPLNFELGPQAPAQAILAAGPLEEEARFAIIEDNYHRTLNRHAYPTLEIFEEAVNQELRELRRPTRRLDAESPVEATLHANELPRLPRTERSLVGPTERTVAVAKEILPPEFAGRLSYLPRVDWTARVNATTFAHWSLKIVGQGRGRASIRVNRLLRTTPKAVPDEALAYLIFHELLHHLLPGQGHDGQFREFESRWPESEKWDLLLDTLCEKWDLNPARYAR